jgi:hypothetical protein
VLPSRVQTAQPNDQVAQGGEVLRRVAGADGGRIFAQGDIPHIVDPFNPPVPAAQALELRRIHLVVGAATEHDLDVLGHRNGFEVMGGAHDEGRLGRVGETALFWGDGKGIDGAGFMSTVVLVGGDVRRGKKRLAARSQRAPADERVWADWL